MNSIPLCIIFCLPIHRCWTFGFFLMFACYEYRWEHSGNSFVWICVCNCLGYMVRGEITGSDGNCVSNHWRNCQTFSKTAMLYYIPTSRVWGFQFFMTSLIFIICLFKLSSVVGVKWYLMVVSICISPVTFHLLIGHLFLFLSIFNCQGGIAIFVICPFLM